MKARKHEEGPIGYQLDHYLDGSTSQDRDNIMPLS